MLPQEHRDVEGRVGCNNTLTEFQYGRHLNKGGSTFGIIDLLKRLETSIRKFW